MTPKRHQHLVDTRAHNQLCALAKEFHMSQKAFLEFLIEGATELNINSLNKLLNQGIYRRDTGVSRDSWQKYQTNILPKPTISIVDNTLLDTMRRIMELDTERT